VRYLAVICVMLAPLSGAVAQMMHEEQTVRASYAKLAYAAKLGVLAKYAQTAKSRLPTALHTSSDVQNEIARAVPVFEFANFQIGNTSDISGTRWETFVSKPQLDLIGVTMGHMPYRMKLTKSESFTEMNYVRTNWQRYENFKGDWSMPTRQILNELSAPDKSGKPGVVYSRYAAYTVTVKLEGRQRTYQAIFLFGRNPDGTEAIWPIDHILGMGSLNYIMDHSIYPQPLLETYLREWPAIRDWISSAAIASNSPARDVVCDGASGKCGIPSQLLNNALQVPIDPESRKFSPQPQSVSPSSKSGGTPTTPTDCSGYDSDFGFNPMPSMYNVQDHEIGYNHFVADNAGASCEYSSSGSRYCNTTCSVTETGGSAYGDLGHTDSLDCHVVGFGWVQGNAVAANGGTSCSGQLTGGAVQCVSSACVGCTISINAGLVSGSSAVIWAANDPLPATCNTEPDPTYGGRSGGCGQCQSNCGGGGGSPIIIDTTGEGFQLTSETDGVRFDIRGDGIPVDLAWTAKGSHNAFLALDRNANGKIDSGKELFGNFTVQPHSADPNGYLALAEFDKPENGGNGDDVIDEHDAVYSKLLLWIDENHDGISQPGELHHLDEMGIHSLSLKFLDSPYTDAFGNQFRYKGKVNPLGQPSDDHIDRISYDVFFVLGKPVYSVPKDSQLQSKNGAAPPPVCQ
jgi:hypothetical protein